MDPSLPATCQVTLRRDFPALYFRLFLCEMRTELFQTCHTGQRPDLFLTLVLEIISLCSFFK